MLSHFRYQTSLESIDPERNRYRRYEILVEPDLFGGFSLTTWRGRIGRNLRRSEVRFHDLDDLLSVLASILQRRVSHGYIFC